MTTPDLKSDDYYKVLGLSRDADEKQVKNAYRKLAIKWHPDKNLDNKEAAEKNFKLIGEAYEVLSDTEKRKMYDQMGKAAFTGGVPGGGFSGQQGFTRAEDIFAQFFGGSDPFEIFFGDNRGGMHGMSGGFQSFGGGVQSPLDQSHFAFQTFGGQPGGFRLGQGMSGAGFPGMQFAQPEQQVPNTLKPGTRVLMKGLISASQWNGTYGEVVSYDHSATRYQVQCLEEENLLALKWENIQQIVRGVELVGVQSRPELNGTFGDLIDFDVRNNRAHVRVPTSRHSLSFKPDNIILPQGTVVKIIGLATSPKYNGRFAIVHGVDRAAGRYMLQLDGNHSLRVRYGNVKP